MPDQQAPPAPPPPAEGSAPPPPPGSGKKILIIEDDSLLVKMYTAKFTREGFEVISSLDGVDGFNKAVSEKPDFIVLDIMMPKMSGLDFLKKLRSTPGGENIPVMVLTNLSDQGEAEKALGLGAKEYLTKANLTPGQVVDKVKYHLGIQTNPSQGQEGTATMPQQSEPLPQQPAQAPGQPMQEDQTNPQEVNKDSTE